MNHRLAYVAVSKPEDRRSWSGINYFMAQSLRREVGELTWIGPLKRRLEPWFRAKQALSRLRGYRRLINREPPILKGFARQAAARINQADIDLVFSPSSLPIAYLESSKPIFFWTDATFASILGFYVDPSLLDPDSIRDGHAAERAALERCALAIYSSDWAAASAVADYQIAPDKVKVVPFGANLDSRPAYAEVRDAIAKRRSDRCQLLFAGVEWIRKGGDIAVEIAKRLNEAGLRTKLIVLGCQPNRASLPEFVDAVGFINKHTKDGKKAFDSLFASSHFLILPSRADCTPVVFSEGCSFGLPCVGSNVGGIPTIIRGGINGMTFDMTDVDVVCSYIEGLIGNRAEYEQLARSTFDDFEKRLNWEAAGRTVRALIEARL